MPRALLFAVVFIEGFCSLGAEIIALRQIIPHMGSSIVVTAPTIGFFLLALALGYHAGGRVAADYRAVVARNFLLAALLIGVGLSGVAIDLFFTAINPPEIAYLLLIGGVLCPVAWLLGQTVPILSNLLQHERVGEASGEALYYSTLGSFLGSLSPSLLLMQWLGVSAAVGSCALLLLAGYALLRARAWSAVLAAMFVGVATVTANAWLRPQIASRRITTPTSTSTRRFATSPRSTSCARRQAAISSPTTRVASSPAASSGEVVKKPPRAGRDAGRKRTNDETYRLDRRGASGQRRRSVAQWIDSQPLSNPTPQIAGTVFHKKQKLAILFLERPEHQRLAEAGQC